MSEKSIQYLVYALKAGLFILPILALIVSGSLFFPFISGKNFFFRIIVEVLFFLWAFVACFDKNYRPRKSPVLMALVATLFFLTLATIFGANPYRSFWSNFERIEGLVGHIHLFAYFLILASTLRKEKDWKWFFASLLGVSFVLTVYGFLQYFRVLSIHQGSIRLDATLGNSTYYAIFMVFHLFIISLFFYWLKNKWVRSGLAVLFALNVLLVFLTQTRGAILGFFGGVLLFAFLMLFFNFKKKNVRFAALGILAALILMLALFLSLKNTSFVQKNGALSRLASISFTERTVESRFTIWKMAFNGFLERPFLGWGPENFNLVFNKYYEPSLYNQEPWFDRAHNIIFDWLISAGILGFLAYWSIWGAV
ncbi:MAG: O-antigen ligase family protein, partial [bacterium]|nr:O-antigen ligase family protein [bacterium]